MTTRVPFALGLLASTPLAVVLVSVTANAQYGQSTDVYGANAYKSYAQAPPYYQTAMQETPMDVPPAPSAGLSDAPAPPMGNGIAPLENMAYPTGGAASGTCSGCGYGKASCQCADKGLSTFGLWSGYSPGGCCNGGQCGRSGCGAGGCATGDCGVGWSGCGCVSPNCRQWFGGIYGLYMDHDDENTVWLSFETNTLDTRSLGSRDAATDWQGGNEIRFGSTFPCQPWAWEFVYWGLYEDVETRTVTAAALGDSLSTSLDFSGIDYDDGGGAQGVNIFFDDVDAHRLRRHFEVQNLEINLIRFPLCGGGCASSTTCASGCGDGAAAYMNAGSMYGSGTPMVGGVYGLGAGCGPRLSIVGTAGIRYMRIDEGFEYASSPLDTIFGNAAEDIFYNIEMENHLVGAQLGAAANYQASQRFSLYTDAKFGVYNNHINHNSRIFGTNGFAVVAAGLPFAGQEYNVQSDKDDLAFLGELRVGGAYMIRPHWRLYGGWRAVGISGVGLPTNQIPRNFADIPSVAAVDSNGSLIIHGLQAGLEVTY